MDALYSQLGLVNVSAAFEIWNLKLGWGCGSPSLCLQDRAGAGILQRLWLPRIVGIGTVDMRGCNICGLCAACEPSDLH